MTITKHRNRNRKIERIEFLLELFWKLRKFNMEGTGDEKLDAEIKSRIGVWKEQFKIVKSVSLSDKEREKVKVIENARRKGYITQEKMIDLLVTGRLAKLEKVQVSI